MPEYMGHKYRLVDAQNGRAAFHVVVTGANGRDKHIGTIQRNRGGWWEIVSFDADGEQFHSDERAARFVIAAKMDAVR